ncbi:hypothetical protein CCMSSC00406_0006498 [Pleurotus cornucopiae]|uniref:Uncharacterized protein n=1 Tax=Pleurotus cornucopiae TaxID=5321 RepID=A0ACB7J6J1_PLECO|nr:hypothetical protein CCMSSC00406_0006498 [Pleurotus cornucopiae]
MSTVNASTGYTPFQLRLGVSPRVLPPLLPAEDGDETEARDVIARLEGITASAQDSLLTSKIMQSINSLSARSPETPYKIGDSVYLSTSNRRREYMHSGEGRVAKFMPRFDGPYKIIRANPSRSSYTLDMPNTPNTFPTFHASLLRPFVANDSDLFPSRELEQPDPVQVDGEEEWLVECIIDERKGCCGAEFLVRYKGYGADEDRWLCRADVEDLEALDTWMDGRHLRRPRRANKRRIVATLLSLLDSLDTPPSPMLLS